MNLPVFSQPQRRRAPRPLRAIGYALTVSLAGFAGICGGDDEPTGPDSGGYDVTLSPTGPLQVARGSTGALTFTITRGSGFNGLVLCAASGLPNNVSAQSLPQIILPSGTTTVITFTAQLNAVNGTYAFNVKCSSPDLTVDKNFNLTLMVITSLQQGPFTLSLSAPSLLAMQSLSLQPITVNINREPGFTGVVAFTLSGLPPLIAGVFTPASTAGNSVKFFIANAGQANGTYTATIRGVATGAGEATTTLPIVVESPTTGPITWNFCNIPPWFMAVKDGTSQAWRRVVPSNFGADHAFNIATATGSVAIVQVDSGIARTTIFQGSVAEITAMGANECALTPTPSGRSASGTITGITANEIAYVSQGYWTVSVLGAGSYQALNLPTGPVDLVATRTTIDFQTLITSISRMVLRRGLNPVAGGTNAVIDFNGGDSFAPATATWTFGNASGENFSVGQGLVTANRSMHASFFSIPVDAPGTTRTIYAIPFAQTLDGDLHQIIATIGTGVLGFQRPRRQVITYTRNLANRNLNFPSNMPAPAVSVVSSAQGRIRFQGTLPLELNQGVSFDWKSTGAFPRFGSIRTTRTFLAGDDMYDIQIPDLSGVVGWDTDWQIRPGALTNWAATGGGAIYDYFDVRYPFQTARLKWVAPLAGVSLPVDGATFLFARTFGTITP